MKEKIYTLLFALPLSIPSFAQVIYTNITPDSTVSASVTEQMRSYNIDLDNNGAYEFELRHFNPGPGNEAVEIVPNATGSHDVIIDASGHARALTATDSIQPTATWGKDQFGGLNNPWYTGTDKYIGIRFKISGAWHYGWARVNIATDYLSFTIKDYAYNATPGAALACGQGTTGIGEVRGGNPVSVYPNPFNTSVALSFQTAVKHASLTITDLSGKQVKSIGNISGKQLILERDRLEAGLYFYRLSQNDQEIGAGKLMIAD